jgi:hypothetical protein
VQQTDGQEVALMVVFDRLSKSIVPTSEPMTGHSTMNLSATSTPSAATYAAETDDETPVCAQRRLAAAAIRAHNRGASWHEFFEQNEDAIARADTQGHRLFNLLLTLVACGNIDGAEPIDSGFERPMSWEMPCN